METNEGVFAAKRISDQKVGAFLLQGFTQIRGSDGKYTCRHVPFYLRLAV
ncbi:MAG: hypothetical protein KAR31_04210 [Candidatus Omnitrophica bacterium]|nr:hypothetical protein [Candidatus Omnitrophota bacterium]MCK5180597.1 hypothetical protein [Candidatus Omnitrophota bacterium]